MFSRLLADVPLKEDWGRWKEAEDSLFFSPGGWWRRNEVCAN